MMTTGARRRAVRRSPRLFVAGEVWKAKIPQMNAIPGIHGD
jgi:hypothetical protein